MNNGTIYQRKDGRWEARCLLPTGENARKMRSFYGKTREEAERKLVLAKQEQSPQFTITEMTVGELISEWLQIVSSRLKPSTLANYRMKAGKHLIPSFGGTMCCTLNAKDVAAFISEKQTSGLSQRYISDIVILLKSMFRYAARTYGIRNCLEEIVLPKCSKPETRLLTKKEQEHLLRSEGQSTSLTFLGIRLALQMGLRIGEICGLRWEDIDFEKRLLAVRRTVQRIQCHNGESKTKIIMTEPKSASSMREIPIPDCVLRFLKQNTGSANSYVMSDTEKPLEPRALQFRFAKILKNANLPSVHFHSLRHAFATNCVALGFDVKTLSEILGHSSVEITLNRYVHSSLERKRACMMHFRNYANTMQRMAHLRYLFPIKQNQAYSSDGGFVASSIFMQTADFPMHILPDCVRSVLSLKSPIRGRKNISLQRRIMRNTGI